MKLWVIKQYVESANEYSMDVIIGFFETKEDAIKHIYEYLPPDVEFWKDCGNNIMIWTNGIKRVVRYVREINSGEILEGYRYTKSSVKNKIVSGIAYL